MQLASILADRTPNCRLAAKPGVRSHQSRNSEKSASWIACMTDDPEGLSARHGSDCVTARPGAAKPPVAARLRRCRDHVPGKEGRELAHRNPGAWLRGRHHGGVPDQGRAPRVRRRHQRREGEGDRRWPLTGRGARGGGPAPGGSAGRSAPGGHLARALARLPESGGDLRRHAVARRRQARPVAPPDREPRAGPRSPRPPARAATLAAGLPLDRAAGDHRPARAADAGAERRGGAGAPLRGRVQS